MKKKWMSGVLCTALLAGSFTPALAETSSNVNVEKMKTAALQKAIKEAEVTREEALEKAKSFVNLSEDYQNENVRFDNNRNGLTVWSVSWSKQEDGNHHHVDVRVDAETGDVIAMDKHFHGAQPNRAFSPDFEYEKAVTIAKNYIMDEFPDKMGKLSLDEQANERYEERPLSQQDAYRVNFNQKVNDIQFDQNNIQIEVGSDGEVKGFHYSWRSDVTFEEPENVLSNEKAFELLKEQMNVELRYHVDPYLEERTGKKVEPNLKYTPVLKDYEHGLPAYMDAQTGDWLNYEGKLLSELENTYEVAEEPVAEEATSKEEPDEDLTQKEAIQIVEDTFDLPDKYTLEDARYEDHNPMPSGNATWRFHYRDQEQAAPMSLSIQVDAKTGQVLNFQDDMMYRYGEVLPENYKVNITKEEAKEKAVELVKNIAPSKLDHLYATTVQESTYNGSDKPTSYDVTFVRKENGIIVEGNEARVSISTKNGELLRYNLRWNDLEFPSAEDVLSKDKAKEDILSHYSMDLSYHLPRTNDEEERVTEAMLVHQPIRDISQYNVFYDAKTGKWVNAETGKEYTKGGQKPQDIEGHKAEEALSTMVEHGVFKLDDEGNVNPDEKVSRGDLVKYMMVALGYDRYYSSQDIDMFEDVSKENENYRYISTALQRNMLDNDSDNFNPNEKAEREFVAKLLVTALGYDELASMDGVFSTDFNDSDEMEFQGHVALATRLGILNGEESSFNPNETVTKAQFANSLLAFLEVEPKLD
ncbi:S-layer homology domain-containing protein [Pontibacillus yanchengensis]|uniref:SLH domain-containing protein n=1 Tax=Pontibacillus yanchengensis Y32 TaxID=1385514 RepID=A0A0A2TB39_9BACI|nr:S-layer homology domain-containing protein [Pontibacillus yanchengensis]KGP72754.1 hypothetical protein N782_10820 [Pontibacillus yanchengensis Y32]